MTTKPVTLYKPDMRADVSNFDAFDYVRLELGSASTVGYPEGQSFPQVSGYGFFVERCDVPCLITPTKQSGRPSNTMSARVGLEYKGQFNGLSLLTLSGTAWGIERPTIDLIVYKDKTSQLSLVESAPYRMVNNGIYNAGANGGAAFVTFLVPPGAIECSFLQIYAEGATASYLTALPRGQNLAGIAGSTSPLGATDPRNGVVYTLGYGVNAALASVSVPLAAPVVGPAFFALAANGYLAQTSAPILLPSGTQFLAAGIAGTGMQANSVVGRALFK